MDKQIITQTIHLLRDFLGENGSSLKPIYDRDLFIIKKQSNQIYEAKPIVRRDFQKQHFVEILKQQRSRDNLKTKTIVIGEKIALSLKGLLKDEFIDYIDGAGNCSIQSDDIFIHIEGKKAVELYEGKPNRTFAKAGIKAIFNLLLDNNFFNHPYRTIATKSNIALGNINHIITGLTEYGYLLKIKDGYGLTNKEDLIQRWVVAYGEKLKPTIEVGKFRFLNPNGFIHWKDLPLNSDTLWGGEAAGSLYTKFLKPQELTLYTKEKRNDLIKNYSLVPDPNGNISVYQKFWENVNEKDKVPPLLAYADLVLSKDNRNMEVALKIYEKYLAENENLS